MLGIPKVILTMKKHKYFLSFFMNVIAHGYIIYTQKMFKGEGFPDLFNHPLVFAIDGT